MENHTREQREHYSDMISAAVDGALSPEEHRQLLEHLSGCPACREAYEQTLLLHDAFAAYEEPEVPADLTAAVMGRVRQERAKHRRRPLWRLAAAAACLAVILYGAGIARPDRAEHTAEGGVPVGTSLAEADQSDALPGSASEGFPSAAPEVRLADAPNEEQIMEVVITYFNHVPSVEADGVAEATEEIRDKQAPKVESLSVPTLSSSDPELLDWMTTNIPEAGYSSADTANSADATAWLISGAEYEALQAHMEAVSMEYEMDWGSTPMVMAVDSGGETESQVEVICVVYLQENETGEPES